MIVGALGALVSTVTVRTVDVVVVPLEVAEMVKPWLPSASVAVL